MSFSPYGAQGSIVVTPSKPLVTERRIGSRGARLSDTEQGRAVRFSVPRSRNGEVTTNMPRREKILPVIDEAQAEEIMRRNALAERQAQFIKTLPSIHINAND